MGVLNQAEIDAAGVTAPDPVARGKSRFGIVSPYTYGAIGDGVADDSLALRMCIAVAILTGASIDLGCGRYRITQPIATLLTVPITIIGDGPSQCQIIVDPAMVGDVISFRNCWYGAETVTIDAAGATVGGNPVVGRKRPSPTARRAGPVLIGFTITGDRATPAVQNGIVFYDRNDGVVMTDVEVEFIRGIGVCLSGMASAPATNAATLIRESDISNLHVRWCGDMATARPSLMMNCSSKYKSQAGWEFDDANNYVHLKNTKVVFSEGLSFQCNDFGLSSKHSHDNTYHLTIDSQRGPESKPGYVSGGQVASDKWSIANGILTVAAGGTFSRITGVGTGDIAQGLYLFNNLVPPGTWISEIISGPAADGAGAYRLSNRHVDMTTYSQAQGSGNGLLRLTVPMIEFGGGHFSEQLDVCIQGSNVQGSNSVAVAMTQTPLQLHSEQPKSNGVRFKAAIGALDVGFLLQSVSYAHIEYNGLGATVSLAAANITQAVTVDLGFVQAGKSREAFITGSMQNLHVYPGGQRVVSSAAIGDVMTASRWPNARMVLNNGGTLTRFVSVPTSPSFNASTWVQE